MKRTRISRQEIFARLRSQRVKHLGQVKRLYIEAQGDFTLIRNPDPPPGLSILPVEDTTYRQAQQYDQESYVCSHCGNRTVDTARPCTNCGHTGYEYPMC